MAKWNCTEESPSRHKNVSDSFRAQGTSTLPVQLLQAWLICTKRAWAMAPTTPLWKSLQAFQVGAHYLDISTQKTLSLRQITRDYILHSRHHCETCLCSASPPEYKQL